jgi:uncharacterized protein YndB with AHSA1/START domain
MRNISAGRTLAAPAGELWAVLADYPNISDWNQAMNNSFALGDTTEGVGAARECQFGSKGAINMRETVTEWVPEERMVIAVDKLNKQLYTSATMTITLTNDGPRTLFNMSLDYEPKGGPFLLLSGRFLGRLLTRGFNAFMNDLEAAAQRQLAA